MPGPAPKPDAQRRRTNAPMANTVRLPASGRQGPAPTPPEGLLPDYRKVWVELWSTPQAVAWERLGWTRVIGRYILLLQKVEGSFQSGKPSALMLGEVRQLEDRIGLTPMSMLRLRWEVDVEDEVAEMRSKPRKSARSRLKAVDPDAVAGS